MYFVRRFKSSSWSKQ